MKLVLKIGLDDESGERVDMARSLTLIYFLSLGKTFVVN